MSRCLQGRHRVFAQPSSTAEPQRAGLGVLVHDRTCICPALKWPGGQLLKGFSDNRGEEGAE